MKWFFLCIATSVLHAELPSYEVARTRSPIRVDGRLDEPAWEAAAPVGKFSATADGSAAEVQTEAKILFDDQYIYFCFHCEDTNLSAAYRKRDDNLWEEEVVEMFIQADPGEDNYIELEVNPLGTMLDIYLVDVRKAIPHKSWNSSRLKWAVKTNGSVDHKPGDHGWTCEIALPLEDVITAPNLPPRPGDTWRLNLYRIEKLPTPAFLAWSPTGVNNFHVPKKFGKITFGERTVP